MKTAACIITLLVAATIVISGCVPPAGLAFFDDPAPPADIKGSVSEASAIVVEWLNSAVTETGVEIERYVVGSPGYESLGMLPPDTTSYTDLSVELGQVYRYRVRTVNEFGESPWIGTGKIFTASPLAPPSFSMLRTDSRGITLNLGDATRDNPNAESVEIQRSEGDSESFESLATIPADRLSFLDASAEVGLLYRYRIRTINSYGASPWVSLEQTIFSAEIPVGDTFGLEPFQYDMSGFDTKKNGRLIVLEFTSGVRPPNGSDGLVGYVEIDADQDSTTGEPSVVSIYDPAVVLGVEYMLELFTVIEQPDGTYLTDVVETSTSTAIGTAVLEYDGPFLRIDFGEAEIDSGDGAYELAMIVGTDFEPTDIAGPFLVY